MLWNIRTQGEIVAALGNGKQNFSCFTFSPDGDYLVSGSQGKMIQLWNVETHKEVATLQGYDSYINSLEFSPDGKKLIVTYKGYTAKV